MHYERWRRHGTTDDPNPTMEERFWAKVDQTEGCWLWTGATIKRYGNFCIGGRGNNRLAHRVAYELVVGPIPDGLVLDHLCRTPACVRPDHLEPVTQAENVLRGEAPMAVNARKTHCPRGHRLDGVRASGRRYCMTCSRERSARDRESA